MNDFLNRIKDIAISAPELVNNNFNNVIYNQLISYNLGKNEIPFKNTENLFNEWIDRNKNKENLKTYVDPKWSYFCQFVSDEKKDIAASAIKLYIPLDSKHLYEGANRLFDYISKENIKHISKIGKKIRNDNVVVRVSNYEEAEKVINFVNSDPYIKEGLLNINPFTINVNGVGIAKDGMLSYNCELCKAIANYVQILKENNRLENININTFHEYLENIKKYGNEDQQMIYNIQSLVTSGKKLNLNDFKNITEGKELNKLEDNKEEIFKKIIEITEKKYGIQHTINAIARYRYSGSDVGFTRDYGARYKLHTHGITKEDVNKFLSSFKSNTDNIIEDYVRNITNNKKTTIEYIEKAYKETRERYGEEQAASAINKFITTGETGYITNQNNARYDLINNVNYSNLLDTLKQELNIDAYCTLEDISEILLENFNEYENGLKKAGDL